MARRRHIRHTQIPRKALLRNSTLLPKKPQLYKGTRSGMVELCSKEYLRRRKSSQASEFDWLCVEKLTMAFTVASQPVCWTRAVLVSCTCRAAVTSMPRWKAVNEVTKIKQSCMQDVPSIPNNSITFLRRRASNVIYNSKILQKSSITCHLLDNQIIN